eukprot:comp23104_c0_seq1/m.37157 comp23104_c0_seq1/g.37157  ORF comp23104_c0_seq1/g.37157 comp23104_c0_seq1/m.37157 type:complete len:124 (+) comp23104_c0_seq1:1256-1627(+)
MISPRLGPLEGLGSGVGFTVGATVDVLASFVLVVVSVNEPIVEEEEEEETMALLSVVETGGGGEVLESVAVVVREGVGISEETELIEGAVVGGTTTLLLLALAETNITLPAPFRSVRQVSRGA